jgi:predicted hydrocarbon binding protein
MSEQTASQFTYSNTLGRILLLGLEEIMGQNGLNALLNLADLPHFINVLPANDLDKEIAFEDISKIQVTLERMYGPHGGHGIALRTGRACFKYNLQEFGAELGLADMNFRLLPTDQKLFTEVERLANVFNSYSDQRVLVQEDAEKIRWHIERCPMCWGRRADRPACHLMVGLLQEAAYWVSGGKIFAVEESSCIARGDLTCTITIDKQPFA